MTNILRLVALCLAITTARAFSWQNGLISLNKLTYSRNFVASKTRVSTLPSISNGHLKKSRMSADAASSEKEQCDGPARSGAIGNVDTSSVKQKKAEDEISTDGVIKLTDNAIKQLKQLKGSRGDVELVLRVGVRSGGCRCTIDFSLKYYHVSVMSQCLCY